MFGRHRKWRGRRSSRRFRGRHIAYVLEWTVCLGLLLVGGRFFYRYLRESPVFCVQWVCIEGARVLDPQTVLGASGITTDDNLLLLDLAETEARVARVPYVKTCRVDRVFPDRVILTIEERAPMATLLLNNGLYEIDGEAVVLRELPRNGAYPGLLITNVPGLAYVEPGQHLTQPAVAAALGVWDAFSNVSMAQDVTVSELAAYDRNKVLMFCNELPFEIRWGRGGFEDQARRLDILWREKGKELDCKEYLDLRFGNDLVCK